MTERRLPGRDGHRFFIDTKTGKAMMAYGQTAITGEDNPVRVIDIFVEELDLADLGFSGSIQRQPVDLHIIRRFC